MRKRNIYIIFIIFMIFLLIYGFYKFFSKNIVYEHKTNEKIVENKIHSEKEIQELIKNYEYGMVEAINKKDFSIVEPYLLKDSNLYNLQKKLVDNLGKRNIKEKIIDLQIENIDYRLNRYNIYVYEKINITYGNDISKIKDFYYIYELKEEDGNLKASDIFTNNDKLQNNISYYQESKYKGLKIKDLYNDFDNNLGKNIFIQGRIIFSKETPAFQDIFISDGENIIHTYMFKKIKLNKDEDIIIYGKLVGKTNMYSKVEIPSIYCDKYDIIEQIPN